MNVPTRQTSPLAIVSLIAGILGILPFPLIASLVAVITGHLARGQIRRQPERYDGDGLALAGLILGYAMILLSVLLMGVFVLLFGGLVWLGLQG
ncbi:DUF4190 domain-containing protein [Luteimonas sp. RD2P54]|uniref:DUF4190 domain-containing protein n=1 Tax=Luteimonas endophytica TaxID=3042023 RepID=A0ABT6J449_9GAMM|nr:DUF4190 domain-containing protein [Luteimonas endophytica]MDH5821591.1 DUF4190 domain-containing protein [Luteimonas endophytica]